MGIPILFSLDPLLGMVLYLVHLLHNKLNFGSPASLSLSQLYRLPDFGCPYSSMQRDVTKDTDLVKWWQVSCFTRFC